MQGKEKYELITKKEIVDQILSMRTNFTVKRDNTIDDYSLGKIDIAENYSLNIDCEVCNDGEPLNVRLSLSFIAKDTGSTIYPCDMGCSDYTKRAGGSLGWYSQYGSQFPSKEAIEACISNALEDFREYIIAT